MLERLIIVGSGEATLRSAEMEQQVLHGGRAIAPRRRAREAIVPSHVVETWSCNSILKPSGLTARSHGHDTWRGGQFVTMRCVGEMTKSRGTDPTIVAWIC